ncbi:MULTISPECIES: sigma-70 family RNA polymerase sigma factor [unclassified Leifsonia]|uniref:sigma-70 family RNA polymerase sigma factor n=1 Tax=unclassified Leifsonia TaxID=2663824 RepID=UPI0007023C8B|nr:MULTISPECIES: sigma-70 family RNA polymerase sigma factor [unclassified Leifsonia]KQX07133.1 RNA polymerase subunit sigma [Leifsonia sp. Root1293]KRA11416.1 RNA polymerase subunit sigma [Leifsonia sp. Root60]
MGDERAEALRVIQEEHAPALWRYVVRLTGDRALADDIVQEVMLRAWRRPEILDQSENSARAWLFTVTRNLVIDDRRSARVQQEFAVYDVPEVMEADATDAALDRWLIADAIGELSRDHRAVLVIVYYGGRSVAEAADELGVPSGTVKSRLHYALRALRLALQERGVTGR